MRSMAAPANQSVSAMLTRAFQSAITPEIAGNLKAKGFAVVDNLFPESLARLLRLEIVKLHQDGHMHKNNTHLVHDGRTTLLEKAHIYEAELTLNSATQVAAPLCSQVNADRTMATMLSLFMGDKVLLDTQAIKLQYNGGQGGCFPLHLDTDAMLDGRLVTAIFYLNPHWRPEHGGLLKLYPWPHPSVTIEPRHNRLALFSSARMLHRVTPSFSASGVPPSTNDNTQNVSSTIAGTAQEQDDTSAICSTGHSDHSRDYEDFSRCCFTVWLSQEQGRRRRGPTRPPSLSSLQPPPGSDIHTVAHFLMHPYVRPHVMKMVYADEWLQSLRESHPGGPQLDALIEKNTAEIGLIRRVLSPYKKHIEALTQDPSLLQGAGSWF